MWSFWRDKYGPIKALEEYYPETLRKNMRLQIALAEVQNGLAAIDAIMEKLNDDEMAASEVSSD